MTGTVDTTRELAAFLRSRRERLDPRDVGLPAQRRSRRTPGLRREEVAELAGISIDYVVRLEQARGLRPSADVLESLAGALRLGPDERAYLFDLARQRPPDTDGAATVAAPSLARLIDDLSPSAAMLTNHRYDILAWNREMSRLLVDLDALAPEHRNAMWLCLMHPEMRERYVDREGALREGIAHLRAGWAAHPDDRRLTDLITGFLDGDADFARLWAERDVRVNGRGRKMLRHPDVGRLDVTYEVLVPLEDPDQRLLIYRPADDESRTALEKLRDRSRSEHGTADLA